MGMTVMFPSRQSLADFLNQHDCGRNRYDQQPIGKIEWYGFQECIHHRSVDSEHLKHDDSNRRTN